MPAQHRTRAVVKAIVVADVIKNRVVIRKLIERRRIFFVIEALYDRQIGIVWFESIDEQIDLSVRGEIRQQFFAVIRDAARLRVERTEISELHKAVRSKQ